MTALSILEYARVTQDTDARGAIENARDLAGHAERWGYRRFWVPEHHNVAGIASAATSLVVAHIAAGTKTIRVGSGGIMLPNHAPYVIAEQFGTLARLYPDRVDLGLGRARGSDLLTSRALHRRAEAVDTFREEVLELQSFLAPTREGQLVQAVPGAGTEVPIWILGSSEDSAKVAADLGLPYAFAMHLGPGLKEEALRTYRSQFKSSKQLRRPHVMISINIVAAETDSEARKLATTHQMSLVNFIRGGTSLSPPPIDDIETYWTPAEKEMAARVLARSIIGSPETVRAGITALIEATEADELIVVSDLYEHKTRLRSFELIVEAAG